MIKMLKLNDTATERIKLYQHEYQLLQRLPLPGVVQPYAFEADQPRPFLVLEDFGGTSLASLNLAGQLTLGTFLKLAIDLADILGQVHAAHVIHKDINPNNIVYHPKTGEVKLIDFSIATALSRETQSFTSPHSLAGTLAYLSPEQTGRINRAIDYRSDFYALGVTFYELLTGQLPFTSDDVMALIHSHIAKPPMPPHERCETGAIPPAISAIVLKLMAKNAEDRYQSAYGLKMDLEHCQHQLTQHGEVGPFPLGYHEIRDQFRIPQKLYGREADIETLLRSFERVSQGDCELLLITGHSGVGKSALVSEVHKPMTEKQGHFITGKFDQYQRDVPYLALSQAFNDLCHQWLSEPESVLAQWRKRILEAVQQNAQVLMDVMAKLEWIVDPQPPAPQVGPQEAQNRFFLVFRSLMQILCQPAHPLVLFIDDLQWADSASLNLLEMLMADPEIQYLLIIGAYRDNELSPTHLLTLTLERMRQNGCRVSERHLDNLALLDVQQLIAETLDKTIEAAAPLAKLVCAKTQGNAFFTHAFLKSLYAEELVTFCHARHTWIWNLEAIQAKQITDNVVTFMAGKITELDAVTQTVLQFAACIGNTFDLHTLTLIAQQPTDVIQTQLTPALQEGLVITLNDKSQFKFQHDHVQQAAYSLIEAQRVKTIHWQIGRLLLDNRTRNDSTENLFEIVDHLKLARELVTDPHELAELARLNLEVGAKAREAAAYQAAEDYAHFGIACLPKGWQSHDGRLGYDDLWFTLHRLMAEVKQLQGKFEDSETLVRMLLEQTDAVLVKAELHALLIVQETLTNQPHRAIAVGKQALSLLGIEFPEDPASLQVALKQHLQHVHDTLERLSLPALLDAPEATNPQQILIIKILNSLEPPSYITQEEELHWLITLKIIAHSCDHGMTAESANGFVTYGIYLGSVLGDYRAGYEYGKFALALSLKFNHLNRIAQVSYNLANKVQPWVRSLHTAQSLFDKSIQAALASGVFLTLGNALSDKLLHLFYEGKPLKALLKYTSNYLVEVKRNNIKIAEEKISALSFALNIFTNHLELEMNEVDYIDYLTQRYGFAASRTSALNCMVLYHFGYYREALHYAELTDRMLGALTGKFQVAIHTLYHFLSLAALYPDASPTEQPGYWDTLVTNQKKLKTWADICPENFEHQSCLVTAEIAALSGQHAEAMALYDQAIDAAHHHGFTYQAALANERAAHYWLSQGKPKFAKLYLQEAHGGYRLWGASRLVVNLEQRYASYFAEASNEPRADLITATANTTSSGRLSTELDFTSVLKASQALGREVELETLLRTLMHIAIENAGAERGCLLLYQDGQWLIQAEGTSDKESVYVLQALPLEPTNEATDKVCHGIINYVIRSRESIVLHDASQSGNFTHDAYVVTQRPKSILCSPLLNQGNLAGLIYLENNLTHGAFTSERVILLDMIMTQAAISLENARLYRHLQTLNADLEDRVKQRTTELQQAQQDLISQAHRAGMADIAANVLHNVGNVLNSVTTSATVVRQTVGHSQVTKLKQANDLVRQHADDLDAFIKQDDKAAKLLRYYWLIAEHLQEEQQEVLVNIDLLQNKIQLINEIVVAQQSYVQGGALEETLVLEDVVELALTLQAASAERHDVTIERDYASIAPVRAQKTKLVHVVVNLVKNAIEAMKGVEHGRKHLTLSIEAGADIAYLRVRDIGCGIAPHMLQ